jgi:oligopeptide/dipeptide ABC transporter ATP-binding protein
MRSAVDELLQVRGLRKAFPSGRGRIVAVDDVSLSVDRREALGLVGESGSGKSTLARCIVRLYDADGGEALFEGQDVFKADAERLRTIRRRMQLVYQDPYSSLNPRMRVGDAIGEAARVHKVVADRAAEQALVATMLDAVGLASTDARRYPREMSGGQRQRVAIARSLAVGPELLIADEAVSALDVSVQAQILNLFASLSLERHLAMIFISHQLAVIAQIAQRVAVMYLGRIVEIGETSEVFKRPRHPYTALLLAAHPSLDGHAHRKAPVLRGELPSPDNIPAGCRFRSRCPLAEPICAVEDPPPVDVGGGHLTWCHVLSREGVSPGMESVDSAPSPSGEPKAM